MRRRAAARRHRLIFEPLEERALLAANLMLTGVEFVNGRGDPIDSPALGEELIVRATYDTSDVAANTDYQIAFVLDDQIELNQTVSLGAGQTTGTWQVTERGWFATTGSHTMRVTLDAVGAIAESSESDNTATISFTPESVTDLSAKFLTPIGGVPYQTWTFSNYLDIDPTEAIADYVGENITYNGHVGMDFSLPNNAQGDGGIGVFAAADGTVVWINDGGFDGSPEANFVQLQHANDWRTFYTHLRQDSLTVELGDTVEAGQLLAYVGSSGSSAAHLHMTVRRSGSLVDPYIDGSTFWLNPLPYAGDSPELLDFGITNYWNGTHAAERLSSVSEFDQSAGHMTYLWGRYKGLRIGDTITSNWYRPDGQLHASRVKNVTANYLGKSTWVKTALLPDDPDVGTWHVELHITRDFVTRKLGESEFYVTATGAPEMRVELPDTSIVLDERFTPYDFGTVARGGSSPTMTFNVINHGSADLAISGVTVPNGFTITEGLPNTLAPGASDTFTVTAETTVAGSFAGRIRIASNDADESEYNFSVEVRVLEPGREALRLGIADRTVEEREHTVAKVYRTGDLSQPLTVSIASSDDSEVNLPATVTIPAGREWALLAIEGVFDRDLDGTQVIEIMASAPGFASAMNTLDVVGLPMTPPTISLIADVSTLEDQPTSAIPFSVSDTDGSSTELTVVANSTNTTLIPTSNIVVTGIGDQRTVVITPAENEHGVATIELVVTDADGFSATTSFIATVTPVNDLPTISGIVDRVTAEDTPTPAIVFSIGDVETAPGDLTLSANSTNTTLVPLTNVTFSGSGASRTVTIQPSMNQTGISTITVTVTDGDGGMASDSFVLAVTADDDSPTISRLADRIIDEDDSTGEIAFTIGDEETAASDLELHVASSDTRLVPLDQVVLGGSGANRHVTVTPIANGVGSSTITITVKDEFGLGTSEAFELTVRPVNDAPTVALPIADQAAIEDQSFQFVFAADTFIEIDSGDKLSYAAILTDDKTLPGWLSFDAATRTFSGTPRNSDVGILKVRVIATDQSNATVTNDFTLAIANTNDAPTSIALSSVAVEENQPGAVIGNVSVTDDDVGDSHTFTISDDRFEVVNAQLKLKPDKMLDHESESTIELNITATDTGSLSKSGGFTLTVDDVNEFAPSVNASQLAVDENAANGMLVGVLRAVDEDTSQTSQFELIGSSAFSIDSASGEIRVADSTQLDHEANEQLSISVMVTDNGTPPKSTTNDVAIAVNDVNEFTPVVADRSFHITENAPNGSSVGLVSGTDQDHRQHLSYRITGASIANAFTIVADTGELVVRDETVLDYEARTEVSVIVEVQDSGLPPRSSTKVVTVEIEDVNEFAPTVEDQSFFIDENTPGGVYVGVVDAHDPDRFQTLRYVLLDSTRNNAFTLDAATGEITVSTTQLDHETTPQHQLLIEVTDDVAPTRSSIATITIDIRDLNEFTPTISDQGFAIDENSSNGTVVGKVFAQDGDTSQALSYAITAGNADGVFEIDESTGELTIAETGRLDQEADAQHRLTIQVTDSRPPSRSATGTVVVSVLDVNEPPQIDAQIGDQTIRVNVLFEFELPDNAFVDPDAGDSLRYTAQLADGSALPNWLSFNTSRRQFSGAASEPSVGTLELRVTASDRGGPSLTETQSFQLTITANPFPWHHTPNPRDMDRDGTIAPVDALIVINELNSRKISRVGSQLPLPYDPSAYPFDVNADGFVTPVDALIVINFLNQAAAEGEFSFVADRVQGLELPFETRRRENDVVAQICPLAIATPRFGVIPTTQHTPSTSLINRSKAKVEDRIDESWLEELAFDVAASCRDGLHYRRR